MLHTRWRLLLNEEDLGKIQKTRGDHIVGNSTANSIWFRSKILHHQYYLVIRMKPKIRENLHQKLRTT